MPKFPHYKQTEAKDCGPTCIKIIAKHYGRNISTQVLRKLSETTRLGSSLMGLSEAAESIGLRTLGVKLDFDKLKQVKLPCILHWERKHYVVLFKISKKGIHISDPAFGITVLSKEKFLTKWINSHSAEGKVGVALLVEPTPKLYTEEHDGEKEFGFSFVLKYLLQYKSFLVQLALGLLAGSLLQIMVPFLTQSIVDVGIRNKDIDFIYLVLVAQIFLFLGRSSVEVIRSWILLHLSTRINISMISDFFIKLMNLPIAYFDVRMTGDILQRINDYQRIERVLTTSSLSVLFSVFNLLVFGFVLSYYSVQIFLIFLIGSLLFLGWIFFFLNRRKELDYERFSEVSKEQSKVIELINGMQEIKLHNAEKRMRWNWEHIQASLFKVAAKNLALEQTQSVGSNFINESKNIFVTIVSAKLVINGDLTLGMLLAISYIVGQTNGPILQLINFIRDVQDAKISLDRLGEINNMEDESGNNTYEPAFISDSISIKLEKVYYKYPGSSKYVIRNLSLTIPENKITAIVGASGSGKTTLMKLLLGFYKAQEGSITINDKNIDAVSKKEWREQLGVVMQEGYIFNETVASNICLGSEEINEDRLHLATNTANIQQFIEGLPQGYNTKIGSEGMGLSTGQNQRLLIARAVYKNPKILFFDEATSSLDANNEKEIMQKLNAFFTDRTVIIIAHRLSTVKNAHQIVVLDNGEIVEVGNHQELTRNKEIYYQLVKNQLELD